jgi:phospholipid/cholesterol/gamma-HCH transport system ATP-binding protein
MSSASPEPPRLDVESLAYGYDDARVLQHDLSFAVAPGEVFCVIGGSGCGKSTLLRVVTGLLRPLAGSVRIDGQDFWAADPDAQAALIRRFGMMYQGGALWTSMTLAENVAMPLRLYTGLDARSAAAVASYKLALVGLAGFENFLPAAISGGMAKRAAIARAMALDPSIIFLDEPSAGLDPVTSHRLDDLILDLRRTLGMSFVIVTHELASIFRIADRVVYLDAASHTMTALGPPQQLLAESRDADLVAFLSGGENSAGAAGATA